MPELFLSVIYYKAVRKTSNKTAPRGFALVTVFLFSGIILMMVLALYLSVRGELFLSQAYRNQTAALYLAESALWEAVAQLEADPTWTAGFQNQRSADGNGSYTVTFNTRGSGFKDDESVNNSDGTSSDNFRGANYVPKGCASLVVTANVGGYERQVEALVRVGGGVYPAEAPLMSSGRISLRGSVSIDGRKAQSDPERVDADVHSNMAEAVPDIISWDEQGEASIDGKVSTVAPNQDAIKVRDGVASNGKEPGAARMPIPDVNIVAKVEGRRSSPPAVLTAGTTTLRPPSDKANDLYHGGDLNVQGDLVLDGVNLYVEGDLHINGSITGSGSVFVTGGSTLQGDARIASATPDTVSLFSEGNIKLSGFNGTEYMEAIGANNASVLNDWNQLSDSLQDYQQTLDTSGPEISDSAQTRLNALAQEISGGTAGGVGVPPTVAGRRSNVTQHLLDALANQPDSTAKARMTQKFEDLNSLFFSYLNDSPIEARALQELAAGRITRGGFDAAVDHFHTLGGSQRLAVKNLMRSYVNSIDYDRLGSAYFQGVLFTHGSVYTDSEVTVQGAVAAFDNGSQKPTDINGEKVNPGDMVLQPLTRISYIEEFFKPKDASGGAGAAGAQILLWMGR